MEQDWQHESNLYSKSCHRVIELERKEITLLTQSDEVHNKLAEEKKRSQELEEELYDANQEAKQLKATAKTALEGETK